MLINSDGKSHVSDDLPRLPKSASGPWPIMPPTQPRIIYSSGCEGLVHVYEFASQPNELV